MAWSSLSLTFVGFRTCFGQVFDISRGMYPSVSLFQFLLRVSSGVKLRRAWMIALGSLMWTRASCVLLIESFRARFGEETWVEMSYPSA